MAKLLLCVCNGCGKRFMHWKHKPPVVCPHCQSADYTVVEEETKDIVLGEPD